MVYTVLLKRLTWLNLLFGGFAGSAASLTRYLTAKPLDPACCCHSPCISGYLLRSGRSPTPDVKIIYKAKISVLSVLLRRGSAVVTPLAAALNTSAKALARDERSFWLIFKVSNPVLATSLIMLMP